MSNLPAEDTIRAAVTVAIVGGATICAAIITVVAVIKFTLVVWGLM